MFYDDVTKVLKQSSCRNKLYFLTWIIRIKHLIIISLFLFRLNVCEREHWKEEAQAIK